MVVLLFIQIVFLSSVLYLYLNYKSNVALKYLYIDNIIVIITATLFSYGLYIYLIPSIIFSLAVNFLLVPVLVVVDTLIRFYRTPKREAGEAPDEIVSAADGVVIYIKGIDSSEIPISIKNGGLSKLVEITRTDLLKTPCWLIGIEMTPFDVHKNAAPIAGEVVFHQHFPGKFLSLRLAAADAENERCTTIFKDRDMEVGAVQIASRKVRRIISYTEKGAFLKKGQWYGMITFGSQVDMIIPRSCGLNIRLNQQVYAGQTVIARKPSP
jgi:phosphatidylserine decarboxylase